jgi:tRNA dimethylallyltransferase
MKCDAILIAGPTASGKSSGALALAERVGGVIINADSMQVYREARILTARPSEAEMSRAPHLLYGHVSVHEPYSVGRYQADAEQALKEAREPGRIPIFVGGTGLYFSALTDGIADIPPVPAEFRTQALALRQNLGSEAFHAELTRHDPDSAMRLRRSDAQRILRAYEVFLATGRPLSHWQKELGRPVLAGLSLARYVLMPERSELYRRIDARFDWMMAQGALEEALSLADIDPALPAAKILGRRELLDAQAGKLTLEEALVLAKTASRQYAKRQMTWLRQRMKDWTWLQDASELPDANL